MTSVDVLADALQVAWLARDAQLVSVSVVAWDAQRVRSLDDAASLRGIASGGWQGRLNGHVRQLSRFPMRRRRA